MLPSPSALLSLGALLVSQWAILAWADVQPVNSSFNYGVDKVYGVNIGGWLVLEPWLTPSLFDKTGNPNIIDEWTFTQLQDRETAQTGLQEHWDTFFTETDFQEIAEAGLNHVRIPIGYWAFDVADDEPFIKGQLPYLQKALAWCEKYGLKAIVDLHGAPGSENGYDNSGRKLPYPTWQTEQENIDRTKAILKTIADLFTPNSTVAPFIAPLNEPAGYNGTEMLAVIRDYWLTSYESIRHPSNSTEQSNAIVMIHDAFMNYSYWGDFMTPPEYQGVSLDTHQYQVFQTEYLAYTQDEHIVHACNFSASIRNYSLPVIVGEFSPAITDCATYLNGRGVGARWDGTYPNSTFMGSCLGMSGSGKYFSDDYKVFLRKYWEAQVEAYETGWGWVQWTWKAEEGTGEDWTYKAGLDNGWIPKNVTDRMYAGICDGY